MNNSKIQWWLDMKKKLKIYAYKFNLNRVEMKIWNSS